jgi:DNA-binding MarR family transcriptional regulator
MIKDTNIRKIKAFSIMKKIKILSAYDFYVDKKSVTEIAKDLQISKNTLVGMVENREKINAVARESNWNFKR